MTKAVPLPKCYSPLNYSNFVSLCLKLVPFFRLNIPSGILAKTFLSNSSPSVRVCPLLFKLPSLDVHVFAAYNTKLSKVRFHEAQFQ